MVSTRISGNQTHVTESSNSDIKKLQVLFRKVQKKSPKHAVNVFEGEESHE